MNIEYELIHGSEENCVVELSREGVLLIDPIDKNEPYRFEYYEISEEGKFKCVWDSLDEIGDSFISAIQNLFSDYNAMMQQKKDNPVDLLRKGTNIKNTGFGKK